ncbi:YehS family protein [Lacihabitans lacunae]|uniref:DUF1456 family protein n=1 Tax=Lacihabitans lacunae TaxID=1028214 RepID=A0ABV7YT27_9BACT
MKNNDILRRLRFTFDFGDDKMMKLFEKGGETVTRAQISDWLKKEEDEAHKPLNDRLFATFLNGLIEDKRGAKEGAKPEPEKQLNNNIILRKLKIALNFKEEDMLEVFELAEFRIGKSELSAFFRNPNQSQYRECKDQFLRNFLIGLQLKYKPKD